MTNRNGHPLLLEGCAVLPPMEADEPARSSTKDRSTPKGKTNRRHTAGRFAVLNAFVDCGARLVNPTAQACWLVLYRETQPDGLARVSHEHIAECVGVARLTATRALARLEKKGLLTVVRRGGFRKGPSTYRIYGTPKRSPPP